MSEPTSRGRRRFLYAAGAAAVASFATPALAAFSGASFRSIALRNLHTGEHLNVEYWVNGRYVKDALGEINFHLRDFRTGDVHPIDPRLLDLLYVLHRQLRTREPYQVISGYRSPETNAMLHEESSGVALNSLHMQGMAVDIRVPGRPLKSLRAAAVRLRRGGVGYYPHSDFIHVDVGRVRYW
jgi:uncharacterized protein YcbK (DUF882 family)